MGREDSVLSSDCEQDISDSTAYQPSSNSETNQSESSCNTCNNEAEEKSQLTLDEHEHLKQISFPSSTFTSDMIVDKEIHKDSSGLGVTKNDASMLKTKIATVQCSKQNKKSKGNHNNNILECKKCFKVFNKSSNLKRHELIHKNEQLLICNTCGKLFQHLRSLKRHERNSHQPKEEKTVKYNKEGSPKPKLYQCDLCDRCYSDRSNLNRHRAVHNGNNFFPCEICNKIFTRRESLHRHQQDMHVEQKSMFACDVCDSKFSQLANLKTHKLIHTGERKFVCDEESCGKTFTRKYHLKRHQESHLGLKRFKCNLCSKSFSRDYVRKTHYRNMHNIN